MNEEIKTDVFILDNNTEFKIVAKNIPHMQVFIINKNGKITVQDTSFQRKQKQSIKSKNKR